jgi:hypothetical protein
MLQRIGAGVAIPNSSAARDLVKKIFRFVAQAMTA